MSVVQKPAGEPLEGGVGTAATEVSDLADLASHLQYVREEERRLLARELHDELGGLFTAAKLDATRIKMRLTEVAPEIGERLSHLIALLNNGVQIKRRIIEQLTPSALGHLGLMPALESLIATFNATLQVPIESELQAVQLNARDQLTAYRLVEEGLINVGRFAKASRVHVAVRQNEDQVRVTVTDDGCGFDTAQRSALGYGLRALRNRIESVGGRFTVRSVAGQGTQIGATFPSAEGS